MSRFKANPKQQNDYPKLLNEAEKKRHRDELKAKLGTKKDNFKGLKANKSLKDLNSRRLQMYSGNRGK